MRKYLVVISLMLVLAACQPSPSAKYTTGQELLNEDFSNEEAWENFGIEADAEFKVQDGVYHVSNRSEGFLWGLNQENHTDVVIEVLSKQLSTYEDNFYGVMCRADTSNNGDGYYFLISGDGYGTISYGHGDEIDPLVGPTQTNTVNKGQGNNVIRAVCIGDYLALYVNGNFVLDTRDSTYTSGYAGMAAATNPSENAAVTASVEVTFDDLKIWEATIAN
ncbi:MAG: lipoprotein [Anaerolineae bacterium]|nr:lipoprotein [Anaerolineae bacterium]